MVFGGVKWVHKHREEVGPCPLCWPQRTANGAQARGRVALRDGFGGVHHVARDAARTVVEHGGKVGLDGGLVVGRRRLVWARTRSPFPIAQQRKVRAAPHDARRGLRDEDALWRQVLASKSRAHKVLPLSSSV